MLCSQHVQQHTRAARPLDTLKIACYSLIAQLITVVSVICKENASVVMFLVFWFYFLKFTYNFL